MLYVPTLDVLLFLDLPPFWAQLRRKSVWREMKESSPTTNLSRSTCIPECQLHFSRHQLLLYIQILYIIDIQIVAAVQHSPRGPAILLPPFQISYYRVFTALWQMQLSSVLLLLFSDFSLPLLVGLTMLVFVQPRQWLHHQYNDSAVYVAYPRRFTPETSLVYGLACFVYFAIGMLGEPAFQDPGRSTSLLSKVLSLQSRFDVRLCSYRDNFHPQNQFNGRRQFLCCQAIGAVILKFCTHKISSTAEDNSCSYLA